MAAKEQDLNNLHEALTQAFSTILNAPAEELSPSMLKTISGFLKDNSITCQEEDSSLVTLADRLKSKQHKTIQDFPVVDRFN